MDVTIYTDENLFEELKPEWNTLLKRSSANYIFLSWEWQHTWWQSYHPGDLYVITFREGGELVGIAPCFVHHFAEKGRWLRFIGCVEVTDYLEVVAVRGRESDVLETLADYLTGEGAADWDRIDFCNVRERSLTLKLLPGLLEARGLAVSTKFEDVCPVIKLPDTWDAYLQMLDGKQRRELRRKMRRAQGYGLTWRIVSPEDHLRGEMDDFIRLMKASSPGKAEFMNLPGNRDFFYALAPVFMASGWLQLIFLDRAGEPIATYLNFDYADRIQVYNSGLDLDYMSLSPGWVLLGHAIRHAIENGRREFDFLQGDEDYKYRMGGEDTKVWMLIAEQ